MVPFLMFRKHCCDHQPTLGQLYFSVARKYIYSCRQILLTHLRVMKIVHLTNYRMRRKKYDSCLLKYVPLLIRVKLIKTPVAFKNKTKKFNDEAENLIQSKSSAPTSGWWSRCVKYTGKWERDVTFVTRFSVELAQLTCLEAPPYWFYTWTLLAVRSLH
jgi:hypothetical protein